MKYTTLINYQKYRWNIEAAWLNVINIKYNLLFLNIPLIRSISNNKYSKIFIKYLEWIENKLLRKKNKQNIDNNVFYYQKHGEIYILSRKMESVKGNFLTNDQIFIMKISTISAYAGRKQICNLHSQF